MFCKKCGKSIDEETKFCPFCGCKVEEDEFVRVKEEVHEDSTVKICDEENENMKDGSAEKKFNGIKNIMQNCRKKYVMFFCVFVILVGALVGGIKVINYVKEKKIEANIVKLSDLKMENLDEDERFVHITVVNKTGWDISSIYAAPSFSEWKYECLDGERALKREESREFGIKIDKDNPEWSFWARDSNGDGVKYFNVDLYSCSFDNIRLELFYEYKQKEGHFTLTEENNILRCHDDIYGKYRNSEGDQIDITEYIGASEYGWPFEFKVDVTKDGLMSETLYISNIDSDYIKVLTDDEIVTALITPEKGGIYVEWRSNKGKQEWYSKKD